MNGSLVILDEVPEPPYQVRAERIDRSRLHDRVGREEVRWREHIKDLPRGELYDVLVLLRDALDTGDRIMPPLLPQ